MELSGRGRHVLRCLRPRLLLGAALLLILVGIPLRLNMHSQDWARLAAYQDIVWQDAKPETPRVLLDGTWYELLSIEDVPTPELIAYARRTFGDIWQKRFEEDMVEILSGLGRRFTGTVTLGLRDPSTQRTLTRPSPMNAANRSELMRARSARAGLVQPAPQIVPASSRTSSLSGQAIAEDLAALQREMETRWAYLKTNGVDYRAAIAAVRERGAAGMTLDAYGIEVQKIISLFIDGHANVSGFSYPSGQLPFFIEATNGRFVAIRPDRAGFADPDHPYITRIDGRSIEEWLQAAAPFVSKASPQWMRRNALDHVLRVQFMRGLMGIERTDSVAIQLVSAAGDRTRDLVLPVVAQSARAGSWPRSASRILDGNFGYLRLANMDGAAVNEVNSWMPKFRSTNGLIVDVRGNTGGSRDALRALFPYLMSDSDAPRVINAARYRLHPEYREDHLGGSRYMYREGWSGWSPEERSAIARFKQSFKPEWMPPAEDFSDWHYLVMSRSMNRNAFTYGKPVVVLIDQDSFSATDIFVSAFKGWSNVTLIGTPSGGGSARQVPIQLPLSRLSMTLASMASFQWNGRLYDGHGTQPDILVHPDPEYFLAAGRDNVLDRAIEFLKTR
jgi:Peptidase family S41